jgi:murein L,D-transpeptidase YafK
MLKRLFVFVGLVIALISSANARELPKKAQADSIVIYKGKRQLILMGNNDTLKVYKIALGSHPVGPKLKKGDKKTPEGRYIIDWRNQKSRYYRSLHISYPNEQDKARADSLKVDPGGSIMIHGLMRGWGWLGKNHLVNDWTNGCIAVTNDEIKELWRACPNKIPVIIHP